MSKPTDQAPSRPDPDLPPRVAPTLGLIMMGISGMKKALFGPSNKPPKKKED